MTREVLVGIERVGETKTGAVAVETAPCVDMASSVCAAEVYRAFRVAAGWGVAAANGLQARTVANTRIGTRYLLKRLVFINFSIFL
jgi:hypothetical protein